MALAAWSGTPPADETAAREQLIVAARRCLTSFGARKTGLADIARAAGVSRQTLYRYYPGGRAEIMLAVLNHAAERFSLRIQAGLGDGDDPLEIAARGVVLVTRGLGEDPVLRVIGTLQDERGTMLLGFESSVGVEFTRRCLTRIRDLCPHATDEQFDSLCEVLLRLAISLHVSPGPKRSDEELHATVRGWLASSSWLVAENGR